MTEFETTEEATEGATEGGTEGATEGAIEGATEDDCFDEDADATSSVDFGDVGILFFLGDEYARSDIGDISKPPNPGDDRVNGEN